MLHLKDIMRLLPHRYPFLLVDKVVKYGVDEGFEYAIGIKNITINEPVFQGHFPDEPVFPGVLIIEALAQISGLAMLINCSKDKQLGQMAYLIKVDQAIFRSKIIPGDTVYLNARKVRQMKDVCIFDTNAVVDGKTVASAKLTLVFKTKME